MVLNQRFALPANWSLSGEKNGQKIGRMLSTAPKNVAASEANYLCQP
jgi:hypothetical protein